MEIRESEARRRPAGDSNVNGEQISRSFLAAWERRRGPRDGLSRQLTRRQPPLAPATERGDALATRTRHLVATRKLLITMSDSTADNSRLLFVVGWDLREPSRSGRVGSKRSRAV